MKLQAWSLILPLAVVGFLAPALSSSGVVAQQAPPPANATPDLPPGPGREPFLRICTGCHSTSTVTSERRTAESWANIVDEMRSRGANGSDEDMNKIIDWLAANYPPKPEEKK
jgi:cytochrome c5